MEVVERLDYLVTNAEVMELLMDIDKEAKTAGFKRPASALEMSSHVCTHSHSTHCVCVLCVCVNLCVRARACVCVCVCARE